jgi:prevent-host-death family protein
MKSHSTTVGVFEAKNSLSELIERVGRGGEVTITKHDTPVAKLVPAIDSLAAARLKATKELRVMSRKYRLKGLSARELIAEGRR